MNMLVRTEASGSAGDDFTKGCIDVTKAVVAENDGSKKHVAAQLWLVCSGLQLPLDVEICERYRSTLFNHLHRDSAWNLQKMDFPLFCKGMDKVVTEFKKELGDLTAATPAGDSDSDAPEEAVVGPKPKEDKAPEGLTPTR